MIITILWEDQRPVDAKGFGPHELLLSCLADTLGTERQKLVGLIKPIPKKGNANIRKALQRDGERLVKKGPVFAVLDHDKIRDLVKVPNSIPKECLSGIKEQFMKEITIDFNLTLLIENIESLVNAVCDALRETKFNRKPTPDERDRILNRCAWSKPADREQVCQLCPSYSRIVERISEALRSWNI